MLSTPFFPSSARLALSLAVLALLGACASRQPYERPAMDIPPAFKESGAAAQGLWQPAQPGGGQAVPTAWWSLYGDATLDTLQQQAAAGNQNIAQSVARLRAAQAAVASSSASLLPSLGASASSSRARSGSTLQADGSSNARISTSHSLGLNASWELDLWGRISGTVDAARASAQASADDLAAMRLSVQATVAQTYFSLRAAEAQARLLRETLDAYARSWELTRNRQAAGVASLADVAQAEAQYKGTQVQLLESETNRSQLEHALAALVGQAPAAFSLPATAELPAPPAVPAQLPSQLLERRPDIAAAERRVAAANAQIGVARAAFFPALTLSGSAGYRGSELSNLLRAPNLFWSLGPALAVSLFDGGARNAAVESARASNEQAAAAYRLTVLTALQEVEDNLTAATALAQEQQLQAEALAASQRALDVVNNQYRAGTVGFLNVITAQASVLSSQRSLIDVKNRRLAAVNTLLKNVAGNWEPLAR
ncbi:NodT family efflux transporter outer membrane factor (OMF) lipoprotein [Acidovorax soli]|uniref:NodT family efflux transporter outer membrane factor (OMF) lipoprotein n=1 Tax=Acidovorax soli TaxID=592050 RepID=A0A7X0PC98_9BURK|nr:efflux transporter outer membrane subunit [Acidovorax soli]MBB6559164.1 NodT family efflux transporter outer membrane factor (OMF) lipoprotein [Acidovorax soli]